MKKKILINSTSDENRIAILEDGRLAELFFENPDFERVVGDLYLGKVAKVIPGIKAAFIDLGFKQDAFLHFSDVGEQVEEFDDLFGIETDEDEEDEEEEKHRRNRYNNRHRKELPKLERGQKIIVQITKEPVGNKGVRVTSKVAIPGRYLVFLPFESKVNASKQIDNLREKRRLKNIVRNYRSQNHLDFGAIIRTVAEEQDENAILEDLQNILKTWNNIEKHAKSDIPPALLYKELSVTTGIIRDLLRDDVEKVMVDSKKLFKEITSYVKLNSPEYLNNLELYKDSKPLFDNFNVETEIHQTLAKSVPLRLGGHLIIEKTEAMYVIDVNSGKYARSRDQETNSLKTNLEASREIVRQIRLRDLGGIIVIDFIDVYDDRNKKKIYDELKKEFKRDRAKVTILPMSDFGLVQITRQRVRENVTRSITEKCPLCSGTGIVESSANIIIRIEKWIERYKTEHKKSHSGKLILKVHPMVYRQLKGGTISQLTKLSFKHLIRLALTEDPEFSLQDFRFLTAKTGEDITSIYRGN